MDIKYMLYGKELEEHSQAVNSSETVEMSIMKVDERLWYKGEMMIYEGETEGAEPVELLGQFGNPHNAGKYYVKVINMMPMVEDDD